MAIILPLTSGLTISMLHVITGPDHLAAVTPFAIESKKKAWKVGLSWSLGHLVGMLAIGALFGVFKELIPIDLITNFSEQLAGVVLIGIGIWAFYKIFGKDKTHKHMHVHTENSPVIHSHEHDHSHEKTHRHVHPESLRQSNWASFSIGALHGVAGIVHFLLFLPVLGFENKSESVSYIAGFGIGIVLAMTIFAFAIGKVSSLVNNGHNDVFFKGIRLAGGLFAIVVGVYWVVSF